MRFARAIGIAGLALSATATGYASSQTRTQPACEKEDLYLVSREENGNTIVGKGHVCGDENRYYGWLEHRDDTTTLSSLLRHESGGQHDTIPYVAERLEADTAALTKRLEIEMHPDTVRTAFEYTWRGLFIPIPITVDVQLARQKNAWKMDAVVTKFGIRWKRIQCTATEDMRYNCPGGVR